MNAQQIVDSRSFFAISVQRSNAGPFVADIPRLLALKRTPRATVRNVRDAQLFNAAEADAMLRANPRWSVFQSVEFVPNASNDD